MEFLKGAKEFARNPLGIIALFISLIYGFASLLLNSSAEKLTENERWPLIIFVVIFPVLVLIAFYRLVTNHHGKLYAPADFKDDNSFLRTLSPEEQEMKLESEVSETLGDSNEKVEESTSVPPTRKQKRSTSDQASKEARKQEHEEFRQDLEVVEDQVINSLAKEFNSEVQRNVALGGTNVSFDAFLPRPHHQQMFAEVKAIKSRMMSTLMLERVLYNAVVADKFFNSNFKLILTVVYYFDSSELAPLERAWQRKVEQCPAEVELRFVSRDKLPNKQFKSDS
ncbi:hypothetical protein [Vibrio parahaemolyticus]|uniref:hypothetical protein n=1 Tax=Vibrio parahaemolyticus TaxID=670 RepID=UPI001D9B37BE|nr:hypothetical protein [Vibrio parahaemolyticus]EHY0994014.1 hypothetical protein [Vibrio parahaemolyticus]MCR9669627.1 hypothetical protein [Vibrio parahaemolyticus]MCR9826109.1 hypothetical protein [Vibrio parahaemolyticus]